MEYNYEIRKFHNSIPDVLIRGNYITISSESDSSPVIDFSKTFFSVDENILNIYQFRAPSRYEMYYTYLLKKDSYYFNDGKFEIMDKQIYIEDFEIVYGLNDNIEQTNSFNFDKSSDDYIFKVEERYNALFVSKDTLIEQIILLMLDDYNEMLMK